MYGRTWSRIDAGISGGGVHQDNSGGPARRGLLFAGTERGVYVSFERRRSMAAIRSTWPTVSVAIS